MKVCVVLYLTLLAVSLSHARVTYRQLLQLAKPADDSIKTDHEIQLGELDDEVDFQSILKQMGHDFNFEESNGDGTKSTFDQLAGVDNYRTPEGTDARLDENVKASECACYGKTCVCCCVLTFTYEGKRYYLTLCARVTHTGSSFKVELFLQGTHHCTHYFTSTGNVVCVVNSALKIGSYVYYYSSTKFCFYLYFVVNGTVYRCSSHCLTLSSSQIGSYLTKIDV